MNDVWAMEFMSDRLFDEKPFRILTIVDCYTTEAPATAARTNFRVYQVIDDLDRLARLRGKPRSIRVDNGPEFTSETFRTWLQRVGVEPIRIYPGSPWENGYNERFNGTLRREVLNAKWFATTKQAQIVINGWLRQYNHTRPHQALNMRPLVPETLRRNGPVVGG